MAGQLSSCVVIANCTRHASAVPYNDMQGCAAGPGKKDRKRELAACLIGARMRAKPFDRLRGMTVLVEMGQLAW